MIVSIDIGTSYSSISALGPDGKAHPVEIGTGASMFGSKFSLPSAVFVEENGQVLVGQAAMNQRKLAPSRFQMEFKRSFGETVPIVLGSRGFLPEQLYTELIRHMKTQAETIGGSIECAYMTFPASYGKAKKEKLKAAARAAGLFDVQLVEEPTAAAMSYCAAGYVRDGEIILTFDFGGGTFDAALLRYEGGSFRLLTEPMGLPDCGGVDMDRLIFQDMISRVSPEIMTTLLKNPVNMMRFSSQLGELAVKAKHHLSFADDFQEYIPVGFDMIPYELSREKFNAMIAGMVSDCVDVCRKMLAQAGMEMGMLASVLMVGGTSRVPLVREMVKKMAGPVPVYSAADLDLAVAQGALNYRMMEKNPFVSMEREEEASEEKPRVLPEKPEAIQEEPKPSADIPDSSQPLTAEQLEEMMDRAEQYLADPEQGTARAAALYQAAADRNYGPAQYMLGCLCLEGGLADRDPSQGAELIRKAAENGIKEAYPVLADCYAQGTGVSKNMDQAISWYMTAVENGSREYESAVGDCYLHRSQLPEDWRQAAAWYYRAAQNGSTRAMLALGQCSESGVGVPQSLEQAAGWYQQAADLEDPEGMYRLGLSYQTGSGVQANISMAQYWLRKAVDSGHPLAAEKLQAACSQENQGEVLDFSNRKSRDIQEQRKNALADLITSEMWEAGLDPNRKCFNGDHWKQRGIFRVPYEEREILTMDSTVMHSGQSGFILTDMGIYSKSRFSGARFYGWTAFLKLPISHELFSSELRLTDGRVLLDCCSGDEGQLLQMMLSVQKKLQRLQEERPELF